MTNQLVATEKKAGDFLKGLGGTLQTYALAKYDHNAFIKSAMIALVSNDGLQKCLSSDVGKASIINALRMAAGSGLSLNPQSGEAALIPYGNKVQYQTMKNGLIRLALDSGRVEFITADTVRSADLFELKKTMSGDEYFFQPARTDRGKIDGFFAAVMMKDGKCHTVYMADDQVQEHKKSFSKNTQMPAEGYGQKTVLKRLLNNLHISPEMAQAVGSDNASEREIIDITPEPGTGPDDLENTLKTKKEAAAAPEEAEVFDDKKPAPEKNSDSVI